MTQPLDKRIDEILDAYAKSPEYLKSMTKATIKALLVEARLDELSMVTCHKHGFGASNCPQIKQRIAQFQPKDTPEA